MQILPRPRCHQNSNVAKTYVSPKGKSLLNANVAKMQMLPKCKCCKNTNVQRHFLKMSSNIQSINALQKCHPNVLSIYCAKMFKKKSLQKWHQNLCPTMCCPNMALFLSVSIHVCLFLSFFVHFCSYLCVSVIYCLFMSVYVCFCLFL